MGSSLEYIGTGKDFLNRAPIAQALRSTINKWFFMKLKIFCNAEDTVIWTKGESMVWENIFMNSPLDRGPICKIYNELKKLDIKSQIILLKIRCRSKQRILNRENSNG